MTPARPVLVDTSVCIRYFARPEYRNPVNRLLEHGAVLGHDLVHGELVVGDRGGRRGFLAQYRRVDWAATVPHADAVALVSMRGLAGKGLGWVDVHLLASALASGAALWSADVRLRLCAEGLGIASGFHRRSA